MKKPLLILLLLISLIAKGQLFNPNPVEQFQKNNFSITLSVMPSFIITNAKIDSMPKPKGGLYAINMSYFVYENLSISCLLAYQNTKYYILSEFYSSENSFLIQPYASYFPFFTRKISFDLGYFYGYKKDYFKMFGERIEYSSGISYGMSFQHIFRQNLGVFNDHLGFHVIYHTFFDLRKPTNSAPPFLLDLKIGLTYHF